LSPIHLGQNPISSLQSVQRKLRKINSQIFSDQAPGQQVAKMQEYLAYYEVS